MDLKIKTETDFNPWRVKSIEDFTSVDYSCPECERSFSTSEQFVCHAMTSHQKARDTRVLAALGKKITSASASAARKNRGALGVSGALQTSENNLQKYLK